MAAAIEISRQSFLSERKTTTLVACALFVFMVGWRLIVQIHGTHGLYLADDAYYYTVTAKNIASTGLSTFDSQTLTNGYHPLWLLILVAQYLTFGSSVYVTIGIELALVTAGLWLFLTSFRNASALFQITFVVLFTWITFQFICRGMEISLLILGLGLFTHLAMQPCKTKGAAIRLGLAAVLCIGARLDSAVFVIPTLLLVSGSVRRSLIALTPVVIAGAIYAAVNLWIFGVAFPISGEVKSLGGLQLNHRFLDQLTRVFLGHGPSTLKATVSFLNSFIGHVVLFFLLSSLAFFVTGRDWKSRPLCAGFIIGCLLYSSKILFFSSWAVWEWYGFPAVLGLAAFFHLIDDYLARTTFNFNPKLKYLGTSLAILAASLWVAHAISSQQGQNFEEINLDAATKFAPIFDHARVAMGDRSGSFAAHYAGPVTQLEGLVNDRAYLDALRSGADMRALLCSRGVRFILAYQRDLGDYDHVSVSLLRSRLTQFPSPTLTFSHTDEVGRVFDLTKYDNNKEGDEGDNYLYAWRLTGCAPAQVGDLGL